MVIDKEGSLWVWGNNGKGQLGNGTITLQTTPQKVAGLSGVAAVGGGLSHTLVLTRDGKLYACGLNASGQLGDNSTTTAKTFVFNGLTGVVAIAAGDNHSFAVKSDGSVFAWGLNTDGEVGDGTNVTPKKAPVSASGLTVTLPH